MGHPTPIAFLTSPISWIVIGIVALLLFGRRVPSIARGLGQSIHEFTKGLRGAVPAEPADRSPEASRQIGDGDPKKRR